MAEGMKERYEEYIKIGKTNKISEPIQETASSMLSEGERRRVQQNTAGTKQETVQN